MFAQTVTLQLPEKLYRRLSSNAHATDRPIEDVILHALRVGSPPAWDDVPAEFQADLAEMDRLDDDALWHIAHSRKTEAEMAGYDKLLEKNQRGTLNEAEQLELERLRIETDRFLLRKAHAVVLLRWRGHPVPPP